MSKRPPAPPRYPTFYGRLYAPGSITYDDLFKQLGHRVSSVAEYIEDQAKLILHDQVGASKPARTAERDRNVT